MDEKLIRDFLNPGSGYGDGSGSGYGSGYGDGDGDGYGDGDGDGYGYGYGYGYGVSNYAGSPVRRIDGVPTILDRVHGSVARGRILKSDLTTAPCYVVKGGGYFSHGETLEAAQAALEEKIMDGLPVEDKIRQFREKFLPGHEYNAADFYQWHHFLTGSCEMGRREFAKDHGIDVKHDRMTPERFMELTKDAFGGSVIRQIMEEWPTGG